LHYPEDVPNKFGSDIDSYFSFSYAFTITYAAKGACDGIVSGQAFHLLHSIIFFEAYLFRLFSEASSAYIQVVTSYYCSVGATDFACAAASTKPFL
jgi:hypothetical protein